MTPHYVYTKADVKVIYFNMFNYDGDNITML